MENTLTHLSRAHHRKLKTISYYQATTMQELLGRIIDQAWTDLEMNKVNVSMIGSGAHYGE